MIDNVKCVIFDNDGTIADTSDLIVPCMHYATEKVLGKTWSDEFCSSMIGIPLADQAKHYTDDPELQDELCRVYRERNDEFHDSLIKKFPGCKEALAEMSAAGLTLAVATSKLRTVCNRGLQILEIKEYMNTVVGAEDTERHKPFGDPIVYTAEQLGFAVDQCAYVGDAPFDMRAAKDAHVTAVGVTWGFYDEQILIDEHADYICHDFRELANLFL